MAQILSRSLQYLYSKVAKHLGIARVVDATGAETNFTSISITTDIGYGYYSVTMTFMLNPTFVPFEITKLSYYAYDSQNNVLYTFDISISGLRLTSKGTYIFTVTVYVSDTVVRWTLS